MSKNRKPTPVREIRKAVRETKEKREIVSREVGYVNICGNKYFVIEATHAEMQMEDIRLDKKQYGLGFIKYDHRKIFINIEESPQSKMEILIHEMLHGISEHANLKLSENKVRIIANFLWMAGFHIDGFEFEHGSNKEEK